MFFQGSSVRYATTDVSQIHSDNTTFMNDHRSDLVNSTTMDEPTTILVADDDPISLKLLELALTDKGHRVISAVDGEDAWECFCQHRPKLVITDCHMPRLDGLGLCRRIRDNGGEGYTYIVILTSLTEREAMLKGFEAGADDFMTKPFDRAELEWRVLSGMRILDLHVTLENKIQQLNDAQAKMKKANEEMKSGLQAAAMTQQAQLPKTMPDVRHINAAWSYRPSEHLGGDSLNIFKIDDNRLGFFIVDVCGHGVPSALLAVTLHRVLTPVAGNAGLLCGHQDISSEDLFSDPGRVLTEVNRRLPMKIENGEYFTAVYCVIDTEKSELRYAGAGHPQPVLLSSSKEARRLETEGLPVGFDESAVYDTKTISLQQGDRLCIFSDGVIETKNVAGEMYGAERLTKQLSHSGTKPVRSVVNDLIDNVESWAGVLGQQDDVSYIVLEYARETETSNETQSELDAVEL